MRSEGAVPPTGALAALFCVAAGPEVGFGHLARSAALANALRAEGRADVHFLLPAPEPSGAGQMLASLGLGYDCVVRDDQPRAASAWRRRVDARRRVLVVDRPSASVEELEALGEAARSDVLACFVDGPGWGGPIDLAICGDVYWPQVDWSSLPSRARRCFGPEYLCLRPGLAARRRARRRVARRVDSVLVTMGGSDPFSATPRVVGRVAAALDGAELDRGARASPLHVQVVVGPGFRTLPAIERALRLARRHDVSTHFTVRQGLTDLAPLMLAADLAVSAGGSTLYELALLGTPTIAVPQTGEEALNAAALEVAGACLTLPLERRRWEARLSGATAALLADWPRRRAMSAAGRLLVDGLGAQRVASVLVDLSIS